MFIERFSLPTRVALLGTLGMSAWLIAFSRIIMQAGDDWHTDDYLITGLGLLNGFLMLVNTAGQLRTMLRDNMKWFTNNADILSWISLLGSYGAVLWIQRIWQPGTLDLFLLSFMLVIHSIHTIRFSLPVSIVVLLTPAVLYGIQAGGETGFYLAVFIANQKLVLWGLGMGVLRELLEADKLKLANARLELAQARLADASRQEERRKIRQDLHDKMGHELAAMNMNLQILERRIPELKTHKERATLEQTKEACQRLFSTLGDVVGELRRQTNRHFYDQLMQMLDRVPGLDVSLNCNCELNITDDVVGDNLLCCIQEGITNILKHSNARHAWVDIFYDDNQLHVTIRDDGTVPVMRRAGSGLTGMDGRMRMLGGSAETGAAENGGFLVSLNLPREALI